jgi:signal transduction histidine kinase/DNA-binding LacI/PurR family transcriptional regulator/CheY-like chemotaxis protein/HPt (histidine-containing phosphotransfer) domain-containing protein
VTPSTQTSKRRKNRGMARVSRIGFLVDGLLSRYQVRLFEAIRRAARRHDTIVVGFFGSYLGSVESDRPIFDGSFVYELAGPSCVDGLIVASNLILSGVGAARVRLLHEQSRVPIVSIGPMSGVTTVDVDNRTGLRAVIEHLVVDHGHRRLAFIRGPLTNPDSLERERVFRSTLEGLGIEVPNERVVTGNFLESSGAAAVRMLLGEHRATADAIDGIVAANDQMATGAMQELGARGLRVPEDIVIVGFDDDEHARSANPPLTTVAQPVERIGETSVALLLDKICGRATAEQTILETLPVVRRSCGCPGRNRRISEHAFAAADRSTPPDRVRESSIRRFEWPEADDRASVGIDCARDYLATPSEGDARDLLPKLERIVLDLAARGIDPMDWQEVLSPMLDEDFREATTTPTRQQQVAIRRQKLHALFSELSAVVLLKEQLRTVELANSLRVIGSAVVCARNFRALERVLDVGLPSLDVRYCSICTFTNEAHTEARVATVYDPKVPRPHDQIHSAEQLWRAIPPTLPPGVAPAISQQSFSATLLLPPHGGALPNGDFLVFPLMFGDQALGYVVLDAPVTAQRAWLLEGLSGHLSSAIYEISRTEQLRVAREQAEEANSAKTAFVAMMSHEVRTPLNAILGNLDLCLRTELSKEQRKQLLRAQTSSQALRSIVDDILDYSRVEAHRIDLESVPFELEEILEQVVGNCAPEASRKNLEFVLDVESRIPYRMVGDPLRLTQVLLNLVNNAIKFSAHGHVVLRIARVDTDGDGPVRLRFSVEDSGIGMGEEQLARIFQPFTQADSSITRRYGGTGLGLTICQQLVELMGGEILVRSAIGVGSAFEFTLPFQIDAATPIAPRIDPATVVLAIPNPVQMAALVRLFEDLEHEVCAAQTAADALQIIAALRLRDDVRRCFVFADHQLNDMDCREFSARLQPWRDELALTLILLVPHDNDTLLATNWLGVTGETILAKPPLRSSIERILGGVHSSRPCSDPVTTERHTSSSALTGRRILVVQDSEMSRDLACDLLTLNGAEVLAATDGTQAVALASTERFDLILMDLNLPGVDGCAATKAIRERYGRNDLPIVALTASGAPEDRARCFEAGMNDFLRAPVGANQLLETVQQWLTREQSPRPRTSSTPPSSMALRISTASAPILDIAKALGRLGGNRALYRQLLKRFVQTHASRVDELLTLLDDSELAMAADIAHVFVSSAGNIGATRLQYAAQSLEVTLRQSPGSRTVALRSRFEMEWRDAIAAVNNALERQLEGSQPPPVQATDTLATEHIERLRRLIAEHDTAAVELVDVLEQSLAAGPQLRQALQRLSQSVLAYDFEAAQLHLDSLSLSLVGQDAAPPSEGR